MSSQPSIETRRAAVLVLVTTTCVLAACIIALVASPERAASLHLQTWSRVTLASAAGALALLALAIAAGAPTFAHLTGCEPGSHARGAGRARAASA